MKKVRPIKPVFEVAQPAVTRAEGIARGEWLLLAMILAVGMGLRGLAVSHSAVEHFDEGVYASNVYFPAPDYAYPRQEMYAPPLLPALIEVGMFAGLPPNLAALLPGFLAGCGTIAGLWWFGRSWLGPNVGLAAAMLCAVSDYHVAYSAAALTDVLLGLWILLAVNAAGRSLFGNDYRWAIGAGLYTGLAWWTKYNGWLPLVIEGAAILVLVVLLRPARKQLIGWLSCFAVTALVAVVAWSPYFLSLPPGRYGEITANHARAVVGFGGWLNSVSRQIASQQTMAGLADLIGPALALAMATCFAYPNWRQPRWLMLTFFAGLTLAISSRFASSFAALGVIAPIGLVAAVIEWRQTPIRDAAWQRRVFGIALVASWWGGLFVATPCYWPFPRLVVPWLLATWLGAAITWDELRNTWKYSARWRFPLIHGLALAAAAVAVTLLIPKPAQLPGHGRQRLGLYAAAREIRTQLGKTPGPRAVYVFGEPGLLFQLNAAGEELVIPEQKLPVRPPKLDKSVPIYLLAGPHARRDPQFTSALAAAGERWQLVGTFAFRPSAIVWLDQYDPRQPPPQDAPALDDILLYRLKED